MSILLSCYFIFISVVQVIVLFVSLDSVDGLHIIFQFIAVAYLLPIPIFASLIVRVMLWAALIQNLILLILYSVTLDIVDEIDDHLFLLVVCTLSGFLTIPHLLVIFAIFFARFFARDTIRTAPATTTITYEVVETEDGFCTICREDYSKDAPGDMKLSCSHVFHERCIRLWLEQSMSCPNCRVSVV
jgi:hypothetical protein